jgi:hypothetical protein
MQFIEIIVVSILAAAAYGIVHDQITARICVEYFTIGHPPVFNTQSPTLLGLGWGILATWWVGLILGIPLAVIAQWGKRPKMTARTLLRPIGVLLLCMACVAFASGLTGHFLANAGALRLSGPLGAAVPADRHVAFLTDLCAHLASYASGLIGGIVLMVWVWRKRAVANNQSSASP